MKGLVRQEFSRLIQRSPARLALILAYTILASWSALDGVAWKNAIERAQSERPSDLRVDRVTWTKELQAIESGGEAAPQKARPMNLTLPATLPPGPLAQLAHRGESIHPNSALISGWKNDASLFRRYEIEGPVPLAMRGLDLSYVVIVLFPLVLLLSTFDAVSSERESGRLRLLMVQGLRVRDLLLSRILLVALLLWGVTVLIALVAALVPGAGVPFGRLALWLLGATAYASLWVAAAMWLATRFERTRDVALASLGVWVTFVLLIPSALQFAAEMMHPTPSRVAYLTKARGAESQARRDIEERAEVYMAEHEVELGDGGKNVPAYFRKYFLANAHINAKTAPAVQELESQLESQASILNALEYAAPPMLTFHILQEATGTGSERASKFRKQVRDHLGLLHKTIGPATVSKRRLTVAQANAVPDFEYAEGPAKPGTWLGIGWVLLLSCFLTGSAMRRAREISPVTRA